MQGQWVAGAARSVQESIEESAGPILLGYVFHWGLFGVLTVQVYMYYLAFTKEKASLRCLVYGLFTIEAIQTALITYELFRAFATNYGNIAAFSNPQVSWLAVPIFSGIVSGAVQIYFAHRISILSGSRIIGLIIAILAVTQGTSSIVAGAQARTVGDVSHLQEKTDVGTTIWLAGSALCDVLIAVSMTYFLSRFDTKYKETQAVISKFIRLTIETGTMTATVAVIDLILFLVFPRKNFHITPALVLAKLYSNTLLVMLNSRMHVSRAREDSTIAQRSQWPTLNFVQSTQRTSIQVENDRRGIASNDVHMSDHTDASTLCPWPQS
ncbi:uncharacterized protein EV420DRAFT_617008 [Desarmillaria tabescens]|uniref:DUF6534 domain-containing protein n=1 Tax=Armillaria tabescens TaxID=1929756 RepID=A0AA39K641_ARMTA|nr:uncharacterized protein EV420DRAFT_617008 [Desarmillaria tabescens]KAK0454046.1 hypothetical protein EV420DRAFT_617008 [Desarmillaria tabescens]